MRFREGQCVFTNSAMDRSCNVFKPMCNRFLFDTREDFSILIRAIYNNRRRFHAAHFFFGTIIRSSGTGMAMSGAKSDCFSLQGGIQRFVAPDRKHNTLDPERKGLMRNES